MTNEPPTPGVLFGTCTGGTGQEMRDYPRLTIAPAQWGEGVRVASNGKAVDEIARACGHEVKHLVDVAAHYQINMAELFDALRWVLDHPAG
jgi:hypothetical protein